MEIDATSHCSKIFGSSRLSSSGVTLKADQQQDDVPVEANVEHDDRGYDDGGRYNITIEVNDLDVGTLIPQTHIKIPLEESIAHIGTRRYASKHKSPAELVYALLITKEDFQLLLITEEDFLSYIGKQYEVPIQIF